MPFVWTDEKYATGVKEIDEQHKQLFKTINEMEEVIEKPELDTWQVKKLIIFLGIYTKRHFGYEEDCMFKNNCPIYKKNEDAHKKFLTFYKDIRAESEEVGITRGLAKRLYDASGNWLVNHIGKIDVHIRDCV